MSSSLLIKHSSQTGKEICRAFFKTIIFTMFSTGKIMEDLCESYSTVKNWTRTSHQNVAKFYEALGLEQEEDDRNKKLAIRFYAGEWIIKTSSPTHHQDSTQVKQNKEQRVSQRLNGIFKFKFFLLSTYHIGHLHTLFR